MTDAPGILFEGGKSLPTVITAGIGFYSVWFSLKRNAGVAEHSRRFDAKKDIRNLRVKYCEEAVSVCGELAACFVEKNTEEFVKARSHFWQLYWGKLVIVEDEALEDAMIELGLCLQSPNSEAGNDDVPLRALGVARAARRLIEVVWDEEFGKLPQRPAAKPIEG